MSKNLQLFLISVEPVYLLTLNLYGERWDIFKCQVDTCNYAPFSLTLVDNVKKIHFSRISLKPVLELFDEYYAKKGIILTKMEFMVGRIGLF